MTVSSSSLKRSASKYSCALASTFSFSTIALPQLRVPMSVTFRIDSLS
jgi:hypothetical protein